MLCIMFHKMLIYKREGGISSVVMGLHHTEQGIIRHVMWICISNVGNLA